MTAKYHVSCADFSNGGYKGAEHWKKTKREAIELFKIMKKCWPSVILYQKFFIKKEMLSEKTKILYQKHQNNDLF